jgi:hypothetical protein
MVHELVYQSPIFRGPSAQLQMSQDAVRRVSVRSTHLVRKLKCGGGEVDLSSTHVPLYNCLFVNAQDSKAEIFDVFLCHNSEDKPAVREIAQQLVREGITPWLDEKGNQTRNLLANGA